MGHVTSVLGLENHLESKDPTITMVVIVIVGSMKAFVIIGSMSKVWCKKRSYSKTA